ncbi:MAG TPA: methyl-accepting chemotaxis protein [Ktedonobacterales bacterium]
MRPYPSDSQFSLPTAPGPREGAGHAEHAGQVPDLLGQPEARQAGPWGWWLGLTSPHVSGAATTTRAREYLRRGRLLSALQFTAVVLAAILLPRGFLPVLDPGTLAGIAVFALILLASIILNRRGRVTAGAAVFTGGLALAIAGSQLATPTGTISFQDLAGYDLLVIPLIVAAVLLPSRVTVFLWIGSALFVVLDLGLAVHGANLDAYLPADLPPFLRIYPVAIYPVVLTAVVAVISWQAARSVDRALAEADRTAEVERAYALLAEQKRELEEAIGAIQQVHARVANGDLATRAPTRTGDPLLQLAVSLNLTLDRLARGTLSAATLEATQQDMSLLNQYVAELAQARLQRPAPAQQMRQLAPLALGLERLRTAILQAIQSARAMTEQIGRDNGAVHQQAQALASASQPDPALARELARGVEAVHGDAVRLYQFLSQFL